jgi:ribosome-binding factor A
MGKEYSRTQRIADQMQRELAELIQREIKDPRLGMATVNDVKVSKDLSYADVYVTVLNIANIDDEAAAETSVDVLRNAAGFLRGELSRRIQLRVMPHLRFHYDRTLVQGRRVSTLIDQARAKDRNDGLSVDAPKSDNES